MDINKLVLEVEKYLNESPIRNAISKKENFPFKEETIKSLDKINEEILLLKDKLEVPVKVVLMGEVKAGKSTLLNALAGYEISPTDVLEATATIIEVYYSPEERGSIDFKEGESICGDLKSIKSTLEDNHRDLEFFNNCEKISIGLPLKSLRKIHIVDTPGLATITEQNESKTYEYVQNADVVLWVLNSTHLGQEDVQFAIEKVADMGKTILGILNKIDCINTSKEEVIEYAEGEYGIDIDEFFALSAYDAFEGTKSEDEDKVENSGFKDLLDYILNKIEKNAEAVQVESIASSIKLVVKKDLQYHNKYNELLETIKKSREKHHRIINELRLEIDAKIKENLTNKVNNILNTEKVEIIKDKDLFEKYINDAYISKLIENIVEENKQYLEKSWQIRLKEVQLDIGKEFENIFIEGMYSSESSSLDNLENRDDSELIKEGTIKGLMTSGGASGALAFYAAVLGPAASYVTIGQAISAFCPPLLFAGAITGVLSGFISSQNKKNDMIRVIESNVNQVKNQLKYNVVPQIIDNFEAYNKMVSDNAKNIFEESQGEVLVGDKFEEFRSNIILYTTNSNSIY